METAQQTEKTTPITPLDELWQVLMSNEEVLATTKYSVLTTRIEYYRMLRDMFNIMPLNSEAAQDEITDRIDAMLENLYTSLLGPRFKKAMQEVAGATR